MEEILRAYHSGPAAIQAHADRYQVNALALPNHHLWEQMPALEKGGWRVVHLDGDWSLLVRGSTARQAFVYTHIRPWKHPDVTPLTVHAVLRESEQALAHCPVYARFAYRDQAAALELLGRHEEAREASSRPPALVIR
jgi:hypothetical protein